MQRNSGVKRDLKPAGRCENFLTMDGRHVDGQKVVTLTDIGMTGRGKAVWGGHRALGAY